MVEGLASNVTLPVVASRRRRLLVVRLVTQADSGPAMGHSVTSNLTLHQREGSGRSGEELGLGLTSPVGHCRANFTARAPACDVQHAPNRQAISEPSACQDTTIPSSPQGVMQLAHCDLCLGNASGTAVQLTYPTHYSQHNWHPAAPVIAVRDKRV